MIWSRKNKKGFTLIEVVVVIAIIGILASIVTVSTIAVLRNSERKANETALKNFWRLTAQYIDQVNKRMTTTTTPNKDAIATRLNMDGKKILLSTVNCRSLSSGYIYIQYNDNEKSTIARYSLYAMVYNYNGTYYRTYDGQTVTRSNSPGGPSMSS